MNQPPHCTRNPNIASKFAAFKCDLQTNNLPCFFSAFVRAGRITGGAPPPLRLYSSYREDLGVFLYYSFFSPLQVSKKS